MNVRGKGRYQLDEARRWSRAWKGIAKHLSVKGAAAQQRWEAIYQQKYDRIAELEDALRKARPLLQDTVDAHRDPSDADYNECDTDPCAWCVVAREVLEKPNE